MPQSMGSASTMKELARPGTSSRPISTHSVVSASTMDKNNHQAMFYVPLLFILVDMRP